MTQPLVRQWESRLSLGLAVFWFVVTVIAGLWEVGWRFARLPAWFYAYALLAVSTVPLSLHLQDLARAEKPYWKRVLLDGFGTLIPVIALEFGRKLLNGGASQPPLILSFLIGWTVGALIFGIIRNGIERSRFKEWF